MDFDTAKENIQPLKGGRRADRLETALVADKDILEQERKEHESAINSYNGLDPLDNWYNYICWIEQSFPKSGHESGLDEAVSKCIIKFENDIRYKQDRRLIKLFIKYIDSQDNPHELYEQLYNSGIGTMVADLYIAWSYYYDAANDLKKAEAIFQKGFNAGAQPFDEMTIAHQAFTVSVSQRLLYDDELSRKQFKATMEEKRNVLTTLRAYSKKYVGSTRVGNAVKSEIPGIVPVNENAETNNQQTRVNIHKDDGSMPQDLPGSSSVKSIFDLSKKTENVHEAGLWNKVALKTNKSKLFPTKSSQLGFEIMEDESLPPMKFNNNLYEMGTKLPANFVSKNKPQNPWNVPTVIEEPTAPNTIPCYDKFMCYPAPDIEISPEEWRAYRFFKSHGRSAPIIDQYTSVFENKYEYGSRIYPSFAKQTVKKDVVKYELDYDTENKAFVFPIKRMISSDRTNEYSHEELLAEKFKRGEIKLVSNEDFEESHLSDNMDITEIGDRRESVYLPRKSIVPRKSILRKSVMQPLIEEESGKTELTIKVNENRVRFGEASAEESKVEQQFEEASHSVLKRKLEIDEEEKANVKHRSLSPESKRFSGGTEETFKAPDPPKAVSKPAFDIFDDESDETFSTKNFNLFVKSVSTPIGKKTVPRLVPLSSIEQPPQTSEQQSQTSDQQKIDIYESISPPENSLYPNNIHKLSVIAEVTETSNSTKSLVGQISSHYETDPKISSTKPCEVSKVERRLSPVPMLDVLRLPEDQTETVPFIKSMRLPCFKDVNTPMKTASFKFIDQNLPLTNDSIFTSVGLNDTQQQKNSIKVIQDETNLESSIMFVPVLREKPVGCKENISVCIPSLPKNIIPETQELLEAPQELCETHIEIPATQDISMRNVPIIINSETSIRDKQLDVLEVPDLKNLSLRGPEHVEIPATQEMFFNDADNEQTELPETQDETLTPLNVPDTSFKEAAQKVIAFSVYEDSVCEVPQPALKPAQVPCSQSNVSRKENVVLKESISIQRTVSDEFLELCAKSPQVNYKPPTNNESKKEMSDLLKFSDIKSNISLEASFSNLQINKPLPFKSPSPTMNILEADLNTEKFNLPLNFGKNSTIIGDTLKVSPVPKLPEKNDFLDLSIAMDERELQQLQISTKTENENVFKIPVPPASKPAEKSQAKKDEKKTFEIFTDDQDDDLGRSIYYSDNLEKQLETKPEEVESWEDEILCSFIADDKNRYEYTIVQNDLSESASFKLREAIANSNGNPFSKDVRMLVLEQCNFEQYLEMHVDNCQLLGNVPQLKAGKTIDCGNESYLVGKMLGKGGFGAVFEVRNLRNSKSYAAKQEKPANMWEYYILIELQSRLNVQNITHMTPAFMRVYSAILANNASILVTEYSPYGTIIDVCNKIKKITGKNVDEFIGMIFASQLLSMIDYLHSCHIIHADIKPDNIVLMSKVEVGVKVPALQLIDFGSAIDMENYNAKDEFSYVVTTQNFTCCEMLEKKPWTYQVDLFGICGTIHVILFGKYMEVEKKLNQWQIKARFPRYFKKECWDLFFNTLLNVPDCQTMPNLQQLKNSLDEVILDREKYISEKVKEFNNALVG